MVGVSGEISCNFAIFVSQRLLENFSLASTSCLNRASIVTVHIMQPNKFGWYTCLRFPMSRCEPDVLNVGLNSPSALQELKRCGSRGGPTGSKGHKLILFVRLILALEKNFHKPHGVTKSSLS